MELAIQDPTASHVAGHPLPAGVAERRDPSRHGQTAVDHGAGGATPRRPRHGSIELADAADPGSGSAVEFEILGPTTLHVNGQRIPLGAAKQRGMLALLLYHVGEPVRVSTIVEHLWEGRDPETCRQGLYALVSRIRASLHKAGGGNSLIRLNSLAAYRLNVDPRLIDYHRFRNLTTRAREASGRKQYSTAASLLGDALRLWKDEPVADLRGERAEHIRRYMTDGWLNAHKVLAECRLSLGQPDTVLVQLDPLVRVHDIDEVLARHWIAALCATGREDDARTFFTAFRARYRKATKQEPNIEPPGAARIVPATGVASRTIRLNARPEHSAFEYARPRQLPNDIGDFCGQQALLAELDSLTDPDGTGPKIVAISGMPGAGKTTLAIHWAHRQRHRFPDGQLYLNASAHGPTPPVEPEEAIGRLLRAFDVPADRIPTGTDQRRDRLNQLLTGRRVLIVLDNARDADQVRPLLSTSETCVMLVTSRNRLRGLSIREGVRCITVPPLPAADCQLLLDRVIGTARTTAEPAALDALVQLSGGLPLALRIIGEHVAERSRATIADLVDQLTQHLLDDGEDVGEPNLRTVFAWSYNSLDPAAARLFRILGLHPGLTISTEAAAAVSGANVFQTQRLLDTLARVHLIDHDAARRYRFHELLRMYAADRAHHEEEPSAITAAVHRLLDWYLLSAANAAAVLAPHRRPVPDLPQPVGVRPETFARRHQPNPLNDSEVQGIPSDATAMAWCEAERGNLVAASRSAVGAGLFRHGWQIPAAIHEIFERYGRQDDMRELQELALRSAELDGHQIGQTVALCNLGATYFMLRDFRRAEESFRAGIDLSRAIGLVDGEVACSHNLASLHRRTGNPAKAMEIYQRVLGVFRERANMAGVASTLRGLGDATRRLGHLDQAITYYSDALSASRKAGSMREQGAVYGELANLYLGRGDYQRALDYCQEASDIHSRTKDDAARCDAFTTMADVERRLVRKEEALRHVEQALALSDGIGDSYRRARALVVLVEVFISAGDPAMARAARTEVAQILEELTDPETDTLRKRLAETETDG